MHRLFHLVKTAHVSDPLQRFVFNHWSSNRLKPHIMMLPVVMLSKAYIILSRV